MKYLVNRETKEHLMLVGENYTNNGVWRVVEADSEGWIPWGGGEQPPIPEGMEFNAKFRNGDIERSTGSHCYRWCHFPTFGGRLRDIIAYRPILTEQSEPEKCLKTSEWSPDYGMSPQYVGAIGKSAQKANENISADVTVFDRLRTACEHADSIPAIIAEIDGLLPFDRFEVVEKKLNKTTEDSQDIGFLKSIGEAINKNSRKIEELGRLIDEISSRPTGSSK